MSLFSSPRFLRNVLLADSASCLATGALQLLLTDSLLRWLSLPPSLLLETGVFLVAYAAAVAFVAIRTPIARLVVWVLVALAELQWAGLRKAPGAGWA